MKDKITGKQLTSIPEKVHASMREIIRAHANGGNLSAKEIRLLIAKAIVDPSVREIIFDTRFPPRVIRERV